MTHPENTTPANPAQQSPELSPYHAAILKCVERYKSFDFEDAKLRTFLDEIEAGCRSSMPLPKLSRWLGYVQGVLISQGLTTVEVERDWTRPLFRPLDFPAPAANPAQGVSERARAEAQELAERAGIDMLDDHDQFIDDLTDTLVRFASSAAIGASQSAIPTQVISKLADRLQSAIDGLGRHGVMGIAPVMREAVEFIRSAAIGAGSAEKLGRFDHHPDPAIDFEIEVESLQARLIDAKARISKPGTEPEKVSAVLEDIQRAMTFRVGGDQSAVRAKQILREIEADAISAIGAGGQAVAQFRKVGCSDWYDGLPDNEDGRGPYETRTLYTHPFPSGQAVAVKSLEWADAALEREYGWLVVSIASTPFGQYTVEKNAEDVFRVCLTGQVVNGLARPAKDEAKAAAQADYERRILSALTNPPAQPGWQLPPGKFTKHGGCVVLAYDNKGDAEKAFAFLQSLPASPLSGDA